MDFIKTEEYIFDQIFRVLDRLNDDFSDGGNQKKVMIFNMISICRLCLSSRIERYAQEHGNYEEN